MVSYVRSGNCINGCKNSDVSCIWCYDIDLAVCYYLYFPLQARFYNTVKRTLFNAFFMSVRHLLQTISMLIIDGLVVAGVYVALYMVPQVSMLLLLFGFPLIAFINSYFFTEIFKKYIPKEEDQEHSNGISPLLDENNQEIEDAIQSLKGK